MSAEGTRDPYPLSAVVTFLSVGTALAFLFAHLARIALLTSLDYRYSSKPFCISIPSTPNGADLVKGLSGAMLVFVLMALRMRSPAFISWLAKWGIRGVMAVAIIASIAMREWLFTIAIAAGAVGGRALATMPPQGATDGAGGGRTPTRFQEILGRSSDYIIIMVVTAAFLVVAVAVEGPRRTTVFVGDESAPRVILRSDSEGAIGVSKAGRLEWFPVKGITKLTSTR